MEQMKNSNRTTQSLHCNQEEKNHITLWNFWNDFESCVFHQGIISLLAHGIRESVTTAGMGCRPRHSLSSLCYYTMAFAAGMSKAYLHNLEFLEEEKCLLIIYQLLSSPTSRFNLGYLSR